MLEIRVRDNGCGFPPDLLGPYKPPETQTGHLGLLNVDTILRKHYGDAFGLRLENPEGGGAVFLRACREGRARRMMRVMVVEDEEMIRKGIVMAVDWAALDCIVVGEAANGEQALAVAEDCQPTLIITDLKMPKMDGLEMVRRLREAGSRAYVIILTAYDSFAYAPDGHPSGRGGLSAEAFS